MTLETSSGACRGCGTVLPPSKPHGRARVWCSERCRKASYGDPCVDCGKRTNYGAEAARVPEPRCNRCAGLHKRKWTREAVICAIQEWAEEHGEPPAAADWNPWQAREVLHDEARAARYEADPGRWPSHIRIYDRFGSWGAALEAAGFESRAAHGGGGNQSRRRGVTNVAA